MNLKQRIESEIVAALKSGDVVRKTILRTALGDIQSQEGRSGKPAIDDDVVKVVKKMVEGLRETIQARPTGDPTRAQEEEEEKILASFLPALASVDQIRAAINADQAAKDGVLAAKSDGQAMGIAMKAIKQAGLAVNGADVQLVVKALRSNQE